MAGQEKKCKWSFTEQIGGYDQGPNNAMLVNFKKTPYASLIRESIQNSLDAVLDTSKPVRVVIEFNKLKKIYFPNFFDIEKHIKGCLTYYKNNDRAKQTYEPMLDLFKNGSYEDEIEFIRVSDFNTKGMDYRKNDTNCPFYAFVRSAGVSAKEDNTAGGSFGFGKSAYFMLSPINTIIISTMTKDNKCFFEGITSLCTHIVDGVKYMPYGYYDDSNGEPVTDPDLIPKKFRRTEPGTDFNIIGFRHKNTGNERDEMKQAVIRNFWMAIYENQLEVVIDNDIINHETLEKQIIQYFPNPTDDTKKSNYYNPRPYFDAVRLHNNDKKHILIEKEIDILGKVKLYVNIDKDANDKVIFMRKPKMLVYSKRLQTNYGAYAVFICDDSKGNQLLRELENPAHDEWKPANYRDNNQHIIKDGEYAINSINTFINDCFNSLFQSQTSTSLTITGLEEYLYIPEDLIDNGNDNSTNPFIGIPTGNFIEDGPSITTQITDTTSYLKEKENTGSIILIQEGKINDENGENKFTGTGHKNKKSKTKGGTNTKGNSFDYNKVNSDLEGTIKEYFDVTFRVIASHNENKLIHNIIIYSDYEAQNAEIELILGGEQNDEVPEITYSSTGVVQDNFITNLSISEGKNIISVQFNDNMKHAVKLKAYECK